jgi:hypothetical protein
MRRKLWICAMSVTTLAGAFGASPSTAFAKACGASTQRACLGEGSYCIRSDPYDPSYPIRNGGCCPELACIGNSYYAECT